MKNKIKSEKIDRGLGNRFDLSADQLYQLFPCYDLIAESEGKAGMCADAIGSIFALNEQQETRGQTHTVKQTLN